MFCSECGKQIPDNTKFCNHCGAKQPALDSPEPVQAPPQPMQTSAPEVQNKPKKSVREIIAWVLLALQALATLNAFTNGKMEEMLSSGATGISELIGFFLIGIIGAVLLVLEYGKSKK